mgnify:CR=1 FL=1
MDQFDKMLAKWQPTALSLFRFITGLLLFQYGIAKIFKFPVLPYFANHPAADHCRRHARTGARRAVDDRPVHARSSRSSCPVKWRSPISSATCSRSRESRCSCRCSMAAPAAILFCFACLYLATAGGGPYSVDEMRKK